MNYIGWLAPDGTHFNCDIYGHEELSVKLLQEYYKVESSNLKVYERDDALFNKGWCRIGFQSFIDHGYVIQARWRYLTEEQKSFIQNMYFDVGNQMTNQTLDDIKYYNIIDEINKQDQMLKRIKK